MPVSARHVSIKLPALHPVQQRIHDSPARFRVVSCGRRLGKTTEALDEVVDIALKPNTSVGWFAPTYILLDDPWRRIKTILDPVITEKSEQQHRISLRTGSTVDFWTMDSDNPGRGREYDLVIIDEASIVTDLWRKFYAAIYPTLINRRGRVLMLGTPLGRNDFYRFHIKGGRERGWASFTAPSWDNPFIPPEEEEQALARMPEAQYRQEHLGEFIADGAGVFRGILDVCTAQPMPPTTSGIYTIGVDWGRLRDFTVFSVFDLTTRAQVFLDRFTRVETEYQLMRLEARCGRYQPRIVMCEENAIGIVMIDQLRRRGLPVYPWRATTASKNPVIDTLASLMERRMLTLLADNILIQELQAYQMERLPSGIIRYNAPDGQHDDTVIATALSVVSAMIPEQEEARLIDFQVV